MRLSKSLLLLSSICVIGLSLSGCGCGKTAKSSEFPTNVAGDVYSIRLYNNNPTAHHTEVIGYMSFEGNKVVRYNEDLSLEGDNNFKYSRKNSLLILSDDNGRFSSKATSFSFIAKANVTYKDTGKCYYSSILYVDDNDYSHSVDALLCEENRRF